MNILKKLKKISHKNTGLREFCLETIRFNKFLENARILLDLFADGREKVLGEYILDRHYVITLIERVIERLGMMVFDSAILVPEQGEDFYKRYDQHINKARMLIIKDDFPDVSNQSGDDIIEPEYQLLSAVNSWFGNGQAPAKNTVTVFMKDLFFSVLHGVKSDEWICGQPLLQVATGYSGESRFFLVDYWHDALALPANQRVIEDVQSTPLHLLLHIDQVEEEVSTPQKRPFTSPNWIIVVSENRVSLRTVQSENTFRLDVSCNGLEQEDFIFIFADNTIDLNNLIPPEFFREKSDQGQLAWLLNASSRDLEVNLMKIGQRLFKQHV